MITRQSNKEQNSFFLLGCSDLELSATTILAYYRLRFNIEFLFRDAKQHLGLNHCQSTQEKRLAFHFQAVMMTLNLCLVENHLRGRANFSLQDIKTDHFNAHWLQIIISNLNLDAESIKMHPNYPKLLQWGKMAA
ncbi:MAG: transposase [Bacteroidota bacterium]